MFYAKQVSVPGNGSVDLAALLDFGGDFVVELSSAGALSVSHDGTAAQADTIPLGSTTAVSPLRLRVSDGDELHVFNLSASAALAAVVAYTV